MGVPGFASWLTKKYPAMVSNACPTPVHGLYIDLNGLIHPCCHSEHDASVAQRPEKEKLECICREVDVLVATVRPRELVYIAIDGVAPRAKMNQQRARRYMGRAISSQAVVDEIAREFTEDEMARVDDDFDDVRQMLQQDALYGAAALHVDNPVKMSAADHSAVCLEGDVSQNSHRNYSANDDSVFAALSSLVDNTLDDSVKTEEFDSNCISPGTAFMSRVLAAIISMVEERLAGDNPLWARLCVVVSGANTPGEGEHKIIDFLRTQSSYPGFNGKGAHMIAGLDADLVFLALSLHIPNLFILRNGDRNPYKPRGLQKTKGEHKGRPDGARAAGPYNAKGEIEEEKNEDDANSITAVPAGDECNTKSESDTSSCGGKVSDAVAANTTYLYFSIDVVGSSLVSELHGLCQMRDFSPANEEAFSPEVLVSPNGYHFFRHAGHPDGAMRQLPDAEVGGGAKEKEQQEQQCSRKRKGWREFRPCACPANSKIIDDVIVLAALMGNDFLPRIPSSFCSESALDNLLELYVSDVLPYGFLTGGNHEIHLPQLRRLFNSYARVEAVKFRRFALGNNTMTLSETAESLHSSVDNCWRQSYLSTTGLAGHVDEACKKYVEGLCFVWRYYSGSSANCDWSWYYPFHYGPLALDVVAYLQHCDDVMMPQKPPKTSPPDMLLQLLCIIPPTSSALLPASLGDAMLHPTEDMWETFPTKWRVDYTATSSKSYLATVLLPFADMERLGALVEAARPQLSEEEQRLLQMSDHHLVLTSQSADFELHGDVSEITASEIAAFSLESLREGIVYMRMRDSPPERGRPKTYSCTVAIPWVTCNALGRPHQGERLTRRERRAKKTNSVSSNGVTIINKGPSLAVYLVGCTAASLLTVATLLPWTPLLVLLQVVAVNSVAIFFAFVLGIAVHDPVKGSGIRRNNIRMTFVDWLCAECLCLNFAVNDKCLLCRAPFDVRRCNAIFGSKSMVTPMYDPDHTPYIEEVRLEMHDRRWADASRMNVQQHFPPLCASTLL